MGIALLRAQVEDWGCRGVRLHFRIPGPMPDKNGGLIAESSRSYTSRRSKFHTRHGHRAVQQVSNSSLDFVSYRQNWSEGADSEVSCTTSWRFDTTDLRVSVQS